MRTHLLVIEFLALTVGFTSCNGHVKKDLPKEKVRESKIIADGQPKLIKTQSPPAKPTLAATSHIQTLALIKIKE